MTADGKKRLGDILVQSGAITNESLNAALHEHLSTGAKLGHVIVAQGFMTQERMLSVLSGQLKIPVIDMELMSISEDLLRQIPESMARKHLIFPVSHQNGSIQLAMSDPLNLSVIDEVASKLSLNIEPAIATESGILRAIDSHYGILSSIDEAMLSLGSHERVQDTEQQSYGFQAQQNASPPIARLVEAIIRQGVADRASDIHIEPEERSLRVRYRIDGVMFEGPSPEKKLESAIISRIKIMSKIDIAETRVPQDGRFMLDIDRQSLEFRVSTFPTIYVESVVLRILNKESILLGLEETGMTGKTLADFKMSLSYRQGIIIVTGPTGSGKTTTLYSCLNIINSPEKTIVTIEDPVEYRLKYVRQTQVNPKGGLTFARGLRSILRQDPDVIMVGEIRDNETAEIATRAAMTGHLVFSTMHTDNAVDVIARLNNLGIEQCLIASTLKGVLAQRLVRKICAHCGSKENGAGHSKTYETKACPKCKSSGYSGRTGIFEFLKINDQVQELIAKREIASSIGKAAYESGLMSKMRDDGLCKVEAGITTIEEVNRNTCDN